MVDIRGSGGQGQVWRSQRSGELGDLERVLSFLTSLDNVDPDRICITGSGWGGWLVLAALLANTPSLGEVRCGLARAPVTDWRLGEMEILINVIKRGLHFDIILFVFIYQIQFQN